jgi:pimeloyl-ACP methyl ester carboxylesterase
VLGHSEGAVITPMVAAKEPDLKAIVLQAGVAEPPRSALAFQNEEHYRARRIANARNARRTDSRDPYEDRRHDGRRPVG